MDLFASLRILAVAAARVISILRITTDFSDFRRKKPDDGTISFAIENKRRAFVNKVMDDVIRREGKKRKTAPTV